jgi:Tfp pilus assembly protein PilN
MELLAIMNLLLMILLLLGERRITKKVKEMEDRNLALSKLLIEQQNDNKEITVFSLRCIIKEAIDSSIPGRG